jgi:membrane-bound metal-dependent hydrolase YbcI (DUF457 family)
METLQTLFQAELFQRLGRTLIHFAWQATVIGVILAILLRLLRKSSANTRYLISCMGLVLIVFVSVLTMRMVDVASYHYEPVEQAVVDRSGVDVVAVGVMPEIELPAGEVAPVAELGLKDR